MIRKPKQYPIIKEIKPLIFWHKCDFCNNEFKREKGWSILDWTQVNRRLYTSYCWKECAKTKEEVIELAKGRKIDFEKLKKQIMSKNNNQK